MSEYETSSSENVYTLSSEVTGSGNDIEVRSHHVMHILSNCDNSNSDDNNYFADTEDHRIAKMTICL